MDDPYDRGDRFELVAVTDHERLATLANRVLAGDPAFSVLQEPRPQLVMQRVREPVERRPFNLGEVVVTPAEVRVDGARGFAMLPGKAERAALSGAIVDAAVAGEHPASEEITTALAEAGERYADERRRERAESRHTVVEFDSMEGQE
jgi:alpha-D-ribose 1-methylphosphonate 5-triphosphate synthase subunit PhnG